MTRNSTWSWSRIVVLVLLLVLCLLFIAPLLWMIATSFRQTKDSFLLPPSFLPTPPLQLKNYLYVFETFPFMNFLLNSLVVACSAVAVQLLISAMAAYALSRIPFRGANLLFMAALVGMMVPGQVLVIPLFIGASQVGLNDSLVTLILMGTVYPLGLFILRQYFMVIPRSYDEAAHMDGASRFTVFWRILLPQVQPAIMVVAILHFLSVWNDFFKPLVFLYTKENMTLPLGLTMITGVYGSQGGTTELAGTTLSIILPMVLFIFGQKYIAEGARIGGLKG